MNLSHSTLSRPHGVQPGPALLAKIACLCCAWMVSSCSWDSMSSMSAPKPEKTVAVAQADSSRLNSNCGDGKGCLQP